MTATKNVVPLLILICLCGLEGVIQGQEIAVKFLPEGVTQRVGGYRPDRAEMNLEADVVTTAPEDLTEPKYGKFEIDDTSWLFILDEPAEGAARLFVDTNGDGDLTNDPEPKWESRMQVELATQHDVSGIPFVLLIDGDSGKTLATVRELRGEGLSAFIGEQLEKKNGKAVEDSETWSDSEGDDR